MNYGYVSAELTTDYERDLIAAIMDAGIAPCLKHDFHTTIMYDERGMKIKEPFAALDPKRVFTAHVVSLDVLGDGLVFHLTSKDLHEEHIRLRDAGWVSPYDGYLPHMSLTYNFNEYDKLKLNSSMANWVGRCLTFTNASFGVDKG